LISPKKQSKKYLEKNKDTIGFGIIEFAVMPHYEVGIRDESTEKHIKKLAKNVNFPIYGLDDDSAIVIDRDKLEVVSEGKWQKFEK
jgi:dipeptidase E